MTLGGIQNSSLNLGASPLQASQGVGFRLYDPRDANKDGFVSPFEKQAYANTHPLAAYSQELTSGKVVQEARTVRSSAKANSWNSSDPMDANGDGAVGVLERQLHSLTHPDASTRSSGYVDPMDADDDGVVTALEKEAYLLQHPGAAALERILNPEPVGTYSERAAPASPQAKGELDLYA